MNYVDFFSLAGDNLISLIFFSIGFVMLYILIYRKYILSVLDPMFLIVVASALANCIVFYLYYLDQIKPHYLYSFIVTELAFIAGFFVFRPIKSFEYILNREVSEITPKTFDENFITIMFYWASLLHVFLQLLTYLIVGLPILMESRLTVYSGGTGFGIVGRMVDTISGIGIFLLFYRVFYCDNKFLGNCYNFFYLLFVFFALIVSGNKSNLIFLVYYLFVLNLFMLKIKGNTVFHTIKKIQKIQNLLLISSIGLVFFVISIQLATSGSDTDFSSSLLVLGKRIVSFGDIYYLSLPNGVITQLRDKYGPFLQLIKDPLAMFRIIPYADLPKDNGFAVSAYHYGDIAAGPNPRYNYFAMLYFDNYFAQAFYCFTIGLFLSFLRNKLFYIMPRNILFGTIYALFATNIIYGFQDMPTMILKCTSIIYFFPMVFGLTYITMRFLKIHRPNFNTNG